MTSVQEVAVDDLINEAAVHIGKITSSVFALYGESGLTIRVRHRASCLVYTINRGPEPLKFDEYAIEKEALPIRTGKSILEVLEFDSQIELLSGDVCWIGSVVSDTWIVTVSGFEDDCHDHALAMAILGYLDACNHQYRPEVYAAREKGLVHMP